MRIKSIELAWFRGAAGPVSLEPNCNSMVVYGENGSGKSSFVDAVEYVLNGGGIEHLKTEYSGSHQVKAIPNTHKPGGSKTALRFVFKDDSELDVDFNENGSSKSSGAEGIAMGEWEYRQTVLRQNEVSEFIHDTKGKKYSALLPLFGLHKMEVAAENLRKLSKSVETEAGLSEKRIKLELVASQREEVFGTQSLDQIVKAVGDLYGQYCEESPAKDIQLSLSNEIGSAIENRIKGYSADNQRHVFLKEVAELNLQGRVDAVRASSVDLAESLDPQIAEKLSVLQSASTFVNSFDDTETVDCPACGREIPVEAFREHVNLESERLQETQKAFNLYKARIGDVCDTLRSIKSNFDKPDLKTSADPLQLVAAWFPVDLPVGGKVEHWKFVDIRHPYERYRHVSPVPAGAPVLLQPQLGDPPGHRVLAALSLIDQVEPTASLTPSHESLARLADPDHVATVAGEADCLGIPPSVPARLRSFARFKRRRRQASRPYTPGLALPGLTRLPSFAYPPP